MKRKMKSKPSLKKAKLDGSPSVPVPVVEKEMKGKDKDAAGAKVAPELVGEVIGPVVPSHPNITIADLSHFPRMATLISDVKAIENLSLEDLDGLQNELETLWSSLSVRIRLIQREQSLLQLHPSAPIPPDLLDTVVKAGDHVVSVASPGPSTSSSGRKLGNGSLGKDLSKVDKPPKKKPKGEGEGKGKRRGEKPARAGQNRTHSISSEGGDALHRAEAPSQFWEFAETYCREVNEDDLKTLDGVLEEQKDVPSDLLEIPPLGKAFKEEENNKREKSERTKDICGPLTQKLVAALVDDRISSFLNQQNGTTEENCQGVLNRPGLVRALGLEKGSTTVTVNISLESKLRNVLFDQGLFTDDDSDELIIQNPNDEILTDIKRTQMAFKKLHNHNTAKLTELHSIVKKEVERSAMKKELEKADKDVVEAYKLISNYRLKKKQVPLSKKEKDVATKALENRNAILQKLSKNSHSSTNFNLF